MQLGHEVGKEREGKEIREDGLRIQNVILVKMVLRRITIELFY